MLIAAWIVKRPRKKRICELCGKVIEGPQARLFGAADLYDKPYAVYMHLACAYLNKQQIQQTLTTLPNQELIMLALGEIVAFMPKADAGGASREALWRELWRRGSGMPVIRGA